jgi:farnesyl-diphosphate farnesyltransferase
MGSLGAILKNPDDLYPLLKLKMAARHAEKQIPPEPHWAFCYTMLQKVSRSFAMVIQQLDSELRNAVSPTVQGSCAFLFFVPYVYCFVFEDFD